MTAPTLSITESQILTAVIAFLGNLFPGVPVIKSQANVVAEPSADNFIMLTPTYRRRLSTTVPGWNMALTNPTLMTYAEPEQISIQLDIHGEGSTDMAQVVQTLFRSGFGVQSLQPYGVIPLFCDEGHQMPFVNDQGQYEDRWTVTLELQATPVVSTAQDFADTITVDLQDVDVVYPPGG